MNKKTKMYVGVAVVAVAAYYFWNKKKQADAAAAVAPAKFVGMGGPVAKGASKF